MRRPSHDLGAPVPLPRLRPGPARLAGRGQAAQRAMLLHHLADMHPIEARPYLKRMATEDIATVAAEAYEVIEEA